jgi:hypothetical protein
MTPRKGQRFPKVLDLTDPLRMIHPRAAGVDAHSAQHFVAVPPDSPPADFVNPDPNLPPFVRVFATHTADLEALATWLEQCGIRTVAVESTGVYHLALAEVLEQHGIEVGIIDPRGGPMLRVVPRRMCWIVNGSSGCTATACCGRRSVRVRRSASSAATSDSGTCC